MKSEKIHTDIFPDSDIFISIATIRVSKRMHGGCIKI